MKIIWLACLVGCLIGMASAQKGCKDKKTGTKYNDGDEWFDTEIECRFYRCVDGKIEKMATACIWKDACYKDKAKWKDGCHNYHCNMTMPEENSIVYSVEVKAGCNHNGTCRKNGERWTNECHTYSCTVTTKKDGTLLATAGPTEMGCKFNKRCKKSGETWRDGCFNYSCVEYNDKGVKSSKINTKPACWVKGTKKCIPVGGTVDIRCSTYKCTLEDKKLKLELKKFGCPYNKGCVSEGKTIMRQCSKFKCGQKGDKVGFVPDGLGCRYNGKCYNEGKQWFNSTICANLMCTSSPHKKRSYLFRMRVKASDHGCPWEKKCMAADEKWVDKECNERQCKIIERKFRSTHTEYIVRKLCQDVKGKCVAIGTKGFTALVKGVKFNNCSCEEKGKNNSELKCE
ncbi:uncharacterized protein LOC110452584 [Mizuhopecten yessoensis]|uniref:Uncharacterized protein n=1 Tax=Mizuhopecten yessoensis TaxID=6573 RepID=A0A210QJ31_MIZYE|nr:uncharacterized protein LOC110452584 [Mizuhopecten yessoensis]OWF48798.1 hypothetical protein KP79_PYT14613 [Mizuhopecten yessoensis]